MRYQNQAVRAGTVAKVVALCLFIGGAGIGYVAQKRQNYVLKEQSIERQRERQELERRRDEAALALEKITKDEELERQVVAFQLGLVRPDRNSVRTLPEPQVRKRSTTFDLAGAK